MVGCPPPWMYGAGGYEHDPVSDGEEPSRNYLLVEIAGDEKQISAAEYLILDVSDDSSDDDDDAHPSPEHTDELPLRPMTPFRKACIDVLFVVGTLVMEADLVWVAVQSEGGNWLLRILAMLPAMALYLLIAELLYFASTRDLSGEFMAPPDE
ncbi:uncharacterized protein LOC106865690 isoform X2 [Brachypodium distachyon]|uniref:uncharacterized protein LOC106865690 isoform X2 n=1 Tax=Brachypodium distachyon TaxID=15368 RepID=UPI00071C530B|nr:uncharacterized protein LOC106865690 isoform X2 [Brachypodium distachyon]|eukprot:XP_014751784.1 uncharacterized protein LOC106865690 isoform X2 [Brachypodium distachyon]